MQTEQQLSYSFAKYGRKIESEARNVMKMTNDSFKKKRGDEVMEIKVTTPDSKIKIVEIL